MSSGKDLSKLNQLRQEIDQLDLEIAKLCRLRLGLTSRVFALKGNMKLDRIDAPREAQIRKVFQKNIGPMSSKRRVIGFVRSLLLLNPKYPDVQK
jgi:chorismate mutase